jgi:hypothetical protein
LLLRLPVHHLVQQVAFDRRHLDQQMHQVLVREHQRNRGSAIARGLDGLAQQIMEEVGALDRLGRLPRAGDLAAVNRHRAELLEQPAYAQRAVLAGKPPAGRVVSGAE